MTFYEKVRYLREREGLTQGGLAERVRSWQSRIWALENPTPTKKTRNVDPNLIFKLAEYFQVPVRWLLDDRLGLDDLGAMGGNTQDLSEAERQVLAAVRMLGPQRALARLLGVEPGVGGTPPAAEPAPGVTEARHLKTAILGKAEPGPEGPPEAAISGSISVIADPEPGRQPAAKKKKPRPPK